MHSKNYLRIKNNYDKGLWSKERVRNVVGKSTGITTEEYKQITGEEYNGIQEELDEE